MFFMRDQLEDVYRDHDLRIAVDRSLSDRDAKRKPEQRHTGTPARDAARIQKLRDGFAPLKETT